MHDDDTHHIRSASGARRGAGASAPGVRPSRTQARRRSKDRRRRMRRRRAVFAGAVVAASAVAAFLLVTPPWRDDGAAVAAGREPDRSTSPTATAPEAPASREASVRPTPSKSSEPPEGSPGPEEPVDPRSVPSSGPGTFTVAHGGATSGGGGSRYRVEVEDGIGVDPDRAAEDVAAILADPRGWTEGASRAFRQVDDNSAGLVIRIGTPSTTDRLCGRYGLNTRGEVNCRGGKNVMVNLARWQLGSPTFDGSASEYRALIINHEVGHWLGHGHETCPGTGRPAPAMMQQIKGLKGCVSNAWPYDAKGRYLGGPSVP
ncbi:DUF3152 domain-containing protein [Streptomyces sp. NBC_01460]|uniref:DUF3152 domain-containing protein n=1 Tax=Streptomyces sp. NBC_01460 TaxID=2903875 RepID=UPI002E30FB89|nr:DUF3152 domain-containing protein [Streptomyces sp. NBC_01460]